MTTVQHVFALGFTLLLFVLLANLLVDLYARGAARSALEEGVRAAVPVDVPVPVAACTARTRSALDSVLGGSPARVEGLRCEVGAGRVTARLRLVMPSWLPSVVPGWSSNLEATARRER